MTAAVPVERSSFHLKHFQNIKQKIFGSNRLAFVSIILLKDASAHLRGPHMNVPVNMQRCIQIETKNALPLN